MGTGKTGKSRRCNKALRGVATVVATTCSFALVFAEEVADTVPDPTARHRILSEKPILDLGKGRLPWNRQEKSLIWSYAVLSAVDAYQTIHQPEGSEEANPLLSSWAGERPEPASVLAFKAAAGYGILRLVQRSNSRRTRKWALWTLNSLQLAVDVHNERVTGGILISD